MKLAPFFAISAALHAAGFLYPVHFTTHVHEELIPITVVAMDDVAGQGPAAETANPDQPLQRLIPKTGFKKNAAPNVFRSETTRAAGMEEQFVKAVSTARVVAEPIVASTSAQEEQLQPLQKPFSFNASGDAAPDLPPAGIADGGGSDGSASSGENGQGSGVGRYGSGSGFGSGSELSQSEPRFVPPRYRESPEPTYPESARREGKEGRVLLRVLVDQEGKAKIVQITSSSGYETLDRAAAQTIKRWRFFPARFGGKPVEHWLRFPIDFRLSKASQQ